MGESQQRITHHVTDDKDFTHFEPQTPQYGKLKNGETNFHRKMNHILNIPVKERTKATFSSS